MKRTVDLCLSLAAMLVLSPLMVLVACAVRCTSKGKVLHWSKRVGRHNELFLMPKFRTMYEGTPQLATHLLTGSANHITPVGRLLRKTSLDELPQLWSVVVGDMSLVGPRPALFNQHDLVALRTEQGTHQLAPGITGWAQINGRDELAIPDKVAFDAEYLRRRSLGFDFNIMLLTVLKVCRSDGVQQADAATGPAAPAADPQLETRRAA